MLLDSSIVNRKVFANDIPSLPITVRSFDELISMVDSMPKLMTEDVTIKYEGAETTGNFAMSNFYGNGSISISGLKLNLNSSIHIHNCHCPVTLSDSAFSYTGVTAPSNDDPDTGTPILEVEDSIKVVCENCTFTSDTTAIGVSASCSKILLNNCKLTNLSTAVLSRQGGFVVANCAQSTDASDNTRGGWVYYGGIIIICATTNILLGGTAHKKMGGAIIRPNGTLA